MIPWREPWKQDAREQRIAHEMLVLRLALELATNDIIIYDENGEPDSAGNADHYIDQARRQLAAEASGTKGGE